MKLVSIIARVLLGLMFLVFGLNAFFRFLPMPPPPQNLAGDFMKVFFASGWVYVIGGFQALSGLLLVIGKFVPFGLTVLAAIIVNIFAFHALMAPESFGPAIVVTVLWALAFWNYRDAFAPMLKP